MSMMLPPRLKHKNLSLVIGQIASEDVHNVGTEQLFQEAQISRPVFASILHARVSACNDPLL